MSTGGPDRVLVGPRKSARWRLEDPARVRLQAEKALRETCLFGGRREGPEAIPLSRLGEPATSSLVLAWCSPGAHLDPAHFTEGETEAEEGE